jgi:ankyrin repeat protein
MTEIETSLIQASLDGDAAKVRELLAAGADANVRNAETYPIGYEWNTTPLMCAAAKGHLEVVRVLLKGGADVAAASEKHKVDGGGGNQALHHALSNDHVEVAKALLDAGADANALGNWGRTPLVCAISGMNVAGVRLVLERDGRADLKVKRKGYEPPLFAATNVICNTSSMVAREGKMVLEVQAIWDRKDDVLEVFRVLIAAGADPNAPGDRNVVALARLVMGEKVPDDVRLPVMEMLVDAGARADVADKDGFTPMSLAARFNNPRVIELLGRAPASPAKPATSKAGKGKG